MTKFTPVEAVRANGTLYSTDGQATVFVNETPTPIFIDDISIDESYTIVRIRGVSVETGQRMGIIKTAKENALSK